MDRDVVPSVMSARYVRGDVRRRGSVGHEDILGHAGNVEARGDISPARRSLLEGLAAVHLETHGGDIEKSLAAVSAGKSTRESLARIGDPEIQDVTARIVADRFQAAPAWRSLWFGNPGRSLTDKQDG